MGSAGVVPSRELGVGLQLFGNGDPREGTNGESQVSRSHLGGLANADKTARRELQR